MEMSENQGKLFQTERGDTMGRKIGYVRVSDKSEVVDRQVKELLDRGLEKDKILVEVASGKDFNSRAVYQTLKVGLGKLEAGDELWVHELSRFGRNKAAIKEELEYFKSIGVTVRVLDIPTTLQEFPAETQWVQDMINNILFEVLAAQAEQERVQMLKRQREAYDALPVDPATGKKLSVRTGRPVGRQPVTYPRKWDQVYEKWKNRELKGTEAMRLLGLKKSSFYKLVRQYQENGEKR